MKRWVDIKRQLPPSFVPVYVRWQDGNPEIQRIAWMSPAGWWLTPVDSHASGVTHWAYIPRPIDDWDEGRISGDELAGNYAFERFVDKRLEEITGRLVELERG